MMKPNEENRIAVFQAGGPCRDLHNANAKQPTVSRLRPQSQPGLIPPSAIVGLVPFKPATQSTSAPRFWNIDLILPCLVPRFYPRLFSLIAPNESLSSVYPVPRIMP